MKLKEQILKVLEKKGKIKRERLRKIFEDVQYSEFIDALRILNQEGKIEIEFFYKINK